ncbi:PKD domain-containing protein [Acidobacteriota bacterium]
MRKALSLAAIVAACVLAVSMPADCFLLMPHFEEWNDYNPPVEHYVRWFPQDIPVTYEICRWYDEPSLSGPDDEFDAVIDAFQAWEDVTTSSLMFTYAGDTPTSNGCGYSDPPNSNHTITFSDPDDDVPAGAIGMARTWMNFTCTNTVQYSGIDFCDIMDGDIVINTGYSFVRTGTPGCNNQMDIDAVLIHEIGHMIGLTHPRGGPSSVGPPPAPESDPPSQATMFWSMGYCDYSKASLHSDDEDGAATIYPVETCDPPEYTIAPSGGGSEFCVGAMKVFLPTVTKQPGGTFTYTWDFGDGTSPLVLPTLTNGPHRFDIGGDFTVSLTARWNLDPDNCYFEEFYDVTIVQPPEFHIDPIAATCDGWPVDLAAVMDDPGHGAFVYEWVYGDGDSDIVADPTALMTHTYPVGTPSYTTFLYANHLTLTGCGAETSIDIDFEIPPLFNIAIPDMTCLGQPLEMWGSVTQPAIGNSTYNWEWEFEPGQTMAVADPATPVQYTYPTAGPYDLYLRAINETLTNCNGWDATVVTLNTDTPPAYSVVVGDAGCAGDPIDLSATVSDWGTGTWVWEWEFGDGEPNQQVADPTAPVQHVYQSEGPFTAVLWARNQAAMACEHSESGEVTLGQDDIPTVAVGNTLKAARNGTDVDIEWGASDLSYYNVHAPSDKTLLGDDASGIGSVLPPIASPENTESWTLTDMVSIPLDPLYFEVHPRTSCTGTTVFP